MIGIAEIDFAQTIAAVVLSLGILLSTACSAKADLNVEQKPTHPGLFVTADDLQAARDRMQREPWAKAAWEDVKEEADTWLTRRTYAPEEPAGHFHHYFCPDCGRQLKFDPNKPAEHYCEGCDKVFSGDRYDAAWRHIHNTRQGLAAVKLALAYQLSTDTRYSDKAAAILTDYAHAFPNYPVQEHGGRAFLQSLCDSTWIINLSWAYDLIVPSGSLSSADCVLIENDLLKPCADQISTCKHDQNHQTWHNSAMAAVGWCIGDEDLVRTAVEDPERGLLFQIENDFFDDGIQKECCISSYHFYALQALRWTLDAAYCRGLNLYDDPGVKKMFTAPMTAVFPNGEYPCFNDGGASPANSHAALYEVAYARSKDPEIGAMLSAMYALAEEHNPRILETQNPLHPFYYHEKSWSRQTLEALLYGQELPEPGGVPTASTLLPDVGMAMLRAGDMCLAMDFGPHGGWHGHYDKLSVSFYALGRRIARDTGSAGYGLRTHWFWNKTTASHNTVAVDAKNQAETQGKLNHFLASPGVQFVDASCDTAYEDANLQRRMWMTPQYLVDFFRIQSPSGSAHQTDWFWHCHGRLQTPLEITPRAEAPGAADGYDYFSNHLSASVDDMWSANWVQEDGSGTVRITMLGSPDTEAILTDGIGTIAAEIVPTVIARRMCADTTYRVVIEPIEDETCIADIDDLSADNGVGVRVVLKDGTVCTHVSADGPARLGKIQMDEGAGSLAVDAQGNLKWLQFCGGTSFEAGDIHIRLDAPGSIWIAGSQDKMKFGVASGSGGINVSIPGITDGEVELNIQPGQERAL